MKMKIEEVWADEHGYFARVNIQTGKHSWNYERTTLTFQGALTPFGLNTAATPPTMEEITAKAREWLEAKLALNAENENLYKLWGRTAEL